MRLFYVWTVMQRGIGHLRAGGNNLYAQVLALFAAGEQGQVLDRQNLASMFQDSAGATPVYMPGQGLADPPIGLALDVKHGLVRGAENVTTQDLTNAAWVSGGAFGNYAGSTATTDTITSTGLSGSRSFRFSVTPGQTVEGTASVTGVSGTTGRLRMAFGTSGAVLIGGDFNSESATGGNTSRVVGVAPATAAFCELSLTVDGAAGGSARFTGISAKLVPGNHEIQATAASRPTLSGRYNQLLATATLSTQSITTTAQPYTLTFKGPGTVTLSGTSTAGPLIGTGAGNRVSLAFTPTEGSLTLTVTGSVTEADCRLTADLGTLPVYQRIIDASNYDTAGFPLFAKWDGVDDGMATAATVDFTGTDKMFACAGLTKLSDAALGIYSELSALSTTANPGSFRLMAPESTNVAFTATGTSSAQIASGAGYPAPLSAILTGTANIAGPLTTLRVTGTVFSTVGALGTGNFGNYTLYTARRGGTASPFKGRDYARVIRGALNSAAQTTVSEQWIASKMSGLVTLP